MIAPRKTLLTADWVAPMDRAPMRDAGVVFENGRIVEVGSAKPLRTTHPDARVIELGDTVILPGLVNAHTHLELSLNSCGEAPGGTFVEWILGLQSKRAAAVGREPQEMYSAAVEAGIAQCLRFGVTSIGDISQRAQITRAALRDGPLRCVSYGEVIGLARRVTRFRELLPLATDRSHESEWLRIGISPHAPYTLDLPSFRETLQVARELKLPLATHLAETPHEREFLERQTGEFQQMWAILGQWSNDVQTFPAGPIDFAAEIGLLEYPSLLAHVNYCDEREMELLANGNASVVYCPRTHKFFDHPPHRWREMLARGINVAVGTDSCASSPDLNLVNDLRLLHQIAPDVPAEELWQMATIRGARAIEMADAVGSITARKAADFAVFSVSGDQPLTELLENDLTPREVWIGGVKRNPSASPC